MPNKDTNAHEGFNGSINENSNSNREILSSIRHCKFCDDTPMTVTPPYDTSAEKGKERKREH
jgi:hypothetical protein